MRNWKHRGLAALAAGTCLALTGCAAVVDDSVLSTQANYSVSINMPYATATPLPEGESAPDAIVIDNQGKVSVNDVAAIEGDFQSQQAQQSEYESLSLGSTGANVQSLQARLEALGYFTGDVSGVYDAATADAVKRFEQTYGTMQTGVATSKLQLKLFADNAPAYGSEEYENAVVAQYSVLRAGNVGSSVYALQQRLKDLGYPVGELNGVFDAQTAECVALFYNAYGLASSQVASVSMQQMLYAENALAYDPSIGATPQPTREAPQTAERPAQGDASEGDASEEEAADGFDNLGDQNQVGANAGAPALDDQAAEEAFADLLDDLMDGDSGEGAVQTAEGQVEGDSAASADMLPGSTAPEVKQIQNKLIALGYLDSGSVTGVYDQVTQEAMERYLLMKGESIQDGVLTPALRELILSEEVEQPEARPTATPAVNTILNYGDSGEEVLRLQNRLIELGYADGTADGKYGSSTIQAVKSFQIINDLEADGLAGAKTLAKLYGEDAVSYADGKAKLEKIQQEEKEAREKEEKEAKEKAEKEEEEQKENAEDKSASGVYYKLSSGMAGSAVKKLQTRLNKLGYLSKSKITSSYDASTVSAVKAYQKAIGVSQTGSASASFQIYLYSAAAPNKSYRLHSGTQSYKALSSGSSGTSVWKLQQRLVECGMMSSSDAKNSKGSYNEATKKAVIKAQRKMGYSVCNGSASVEFQAFLYSKYGLYLKNK